MNLGTLGGSAYKAGQFNSLDFRPVSSRYSEDELLKRSHENILTKSLHYHRNNSIAAAVARCMVDYLAGNGIIPVGADPEAVAVWNRWGQRAHISGTKGLAEVYRDIVGQQTEIGDVLLMLPVDTTLPEGEVRTRLECVSGARVRTPSDFSDGADKRGNRVVLGVAMRKGREVGYYVAKPDAMDKASIQPDSSQFDFIPKHDAETGRLNAVLMRRPNYDRPQQTRGLPVITPVMQELKDLADLWDSAIWAAQNKAALAVGVVTDKARDFQGAMGAIQADGTLQEANDIHGTAQVIGDIPQGAIFSLPAESDIRVINASGNIDLDALFLRSARFIAGALGIPMELLFSDFSKVNFSSGKLAFDRFFRMLEYWTATNGAVFTEIFQWINIEASLRGSGIPGLVADPQLAAEKLRVDKWIGGQARVDADPLKNSKAETERLGNGLTTRSQELAKQGLTYRQHLEIVAKEQQTLAQVAEKYEVDPESLNGTGASADVPAAIVEDE